jgi:hypothetical protein
MRIGTSYRQRDIEVRFDAIVTAAASTRAELLAKEKI